MTTHIEGFKAFIEEANEGRASLSSKDRDELITLLMGRHIQLEADRGMVQRQTDQNRLLREFCVWMQHYGHGPDKFIPANGTTWRWFDTFRKWLVAHNLSTYEGRGRYRMTVAYREEGEINEVDAA